MDVMIWKARQGDRAALEKVVRDYYPRVFGLAARMLGNPDEAHDVAQEVFARVLRSLRHYREKQTFRSWIFTITANVVRDLYRKSKRALSLSEGLEESLVGGESADQPIERQEDRERIRAAFDRLPGNDKLLILQIFQQGLSRAEVAEALGISVNAVRIRLHRALELLRRLVHDQKKS